MNEYLEKLNCKQSKINVKPLEEYARKIRYLLLNMSR